MTELSPAAQKVLDAVDALYEEEIPEDRCIIAAALRAAAEIVVPEEQLYGGDQRWVYERDACQNCRKEILAIAKELEN